VENSYQYLGKYGVVTDSNGLIYIRARYYSPDFGRFIQADIIRANIRNPLALNRYRYTQGNPIAYSDINGNWAGIDDLIAIGGGALVGIAGQGLSDLVTTVVDTATTSWDKGEFTFKGHLSDWESYSGAAVGGAAAGETLLYTANPILAGAAGGFAASSTKQGLYALQGKTTLKKAAYDIGSSTVLGGAVAAIPIPAPKINADTYSKAVNNSLISRMQKDIIKSSSNRPLLKDLTKNLTKNTAKKLGKTQVINMSEGLIQDAIIGASKGYVDKFVEGWLDKNTKIANIPVKKKGN